MGHRKWQTALVRYNAHPLFKDPIVLKCHDASLNKWLSTFRRNGLPSPSSVNHHHHHNHELLRLQTFRLVRRDLEDGLGLSIFVLISPGDGLCSDDTRKLALFHYCHMFRQFTLVFDAGFNCAGYLAVSW